ncbi:MAG: hypothetical protein KF900_08545 [Bacteroidetes bacterium]|nr:hypothetical protein [Bacteroidota bacterium]
MASMIKKRKAVKNAAKKNRRVKGKRGISIEQLTAMIDGLNKDGVYLSKMNII